MAALFGVKPTPVPAEVIPYPTGGRVAGTYIYASPCRYVLGKTAMPCTRVNRIWSNGRLVWSKAA